MKKIFLCVFTALVLVTSSINPVFAKSKRDVREEERIMQNEHIREKKDVVQNENASFEERKEALINITQTNIDKFTALTEKIELNQCSTDENKNEAIQKINSIVEVLEKDIDTYTATTSMEELREAHKLQQKERKDRFEGLKDRLHSMTKGCEVSKIEKIIAQYEKHKEMATTKITSLESEGYDMTEAQEKLDAYITAMDTAINEYQNLDKSNISREDLKNIFESIKDAREGWNEMIRIVNRSIDDDDEEYEDDDDNHKGSQHDDDSDDDHKGSQHDDDDEDDDDDHKGSQHDDDSDDDDSEEKR